MVVEYSSKEPAVDCGRGPFVCTKQDAACEALGDLYYATGGPSWKQSTGWSAAAAGVASDYCFFYTTFGTVCSGSDTFTSLWLENNRLEGTLPSSLGDLKGLQLLELGENALSGTVPESLGSLYSLTELSLFYNQLSGTVPASFGGLRELQRLELDQNQLSGPLPTELSSLQYLQMLSFDQNGLSGTVPDSYGSLTELVSMCVAAHCGLIPRLRFRS